MLQHLGHRMVCVIVESITTELDVLRCLGEMLLCNMYAAGYHRSEGNTTGEKEPAPKLKLKNYALAHSFGYASYRF